MDSAFWSIFLVCTFVINVYGIRFNLPPNTQKCLSEDVQQHQLVVMEFEISDAPGQRVDFFVSR